MGILCTWTEIEGVPGYEVSPEGRVRRVRGVRECVVPEVGSRRGKVTMSVGGRVVQRSVRRVVEEDYGQEAQA